MTQFLRSRSVSVAHVVFAMVPSFCRQFLVLPRGYPACGTYVRHIKSRMVRYGIKVQNVRNLCLQDTKLASRHKADIKKGASLHVQCANHLAPALSAKNSLVCVNKQRPKEINMTTIASMDYSSCTVHSGFGNMPCAQCGSRLMAPEWSACVSEGQISNLWWCTKCGYVFETSVYFGVMSETSELELDEMYSPLLPTRQNVRNGRPKPRSWPGHTERILTPNNAPRSLVKR
jgi:NAD-dependent SIR2 family protein deacetylase